MQKQVYDTCREHRYFSPFENILGFYESPDSQIPNTYSAYGNIAMETLMLKCQPSMEKATALKHLHLHLRGYIKKVMCLKDIKIGLVVRYQQL